MKRSAYVGLIARQQDNSSRKASEERIKYTTALPLDYAQGTLNETKQKRARMKPKSRVQRKR